MTSVNDTITPGDLTKQAPVHLTLLVEHLGEMDVEISASIIPGRPARTYGPPEHCYEAEGPELDDWEALLVFGGSGAHVVLGEAWLTLACIKRWEQRLLDNDDYDPGEYADWCYERELDRHMEMEALDGVR
jgi:hypothetical protein